MRCRRGSGGVCGAIPGARARWEEIQVANDLTDGTVGAAKDALASATEDAEGARCTY